MDRIASNWYVAVVVGAGFLYYSWVSHTVSEGSHAEPREVTCAELARTGPADNGHVVVTDFDVSDDFIYQAKTGSSHWEWVWLPVVPAGTLAGGRARDFSVVIKTARVNNEAELQAFIHGERRVQGLIVNAVTPLRGDERRLLGESYPSVNLNKVWVIQEGRTPNSPSTVLAWLLAGVLALALGAGLLVIHVRR